MVQAGRSIRDVESIAVGRSIRELRRLRELKQILDKP